jgi:hypothetical protein
MGTMMPPRFLATAAAMTFPTTSMWWLVVVFLLVLTMHPLPWTRHCPQDPSRRPQQQCPSQRCRRRRPGDVITFHRATPLCPPHPSGMPSSVDCFLFIMSAACKIPHDGCGDGGRVALAMSCSRCPSHENRTTLFTPPQIDCRWVLSFSVVVARFLLLGRTISPPVSSSSSQSLVLLYFLPPPQSIVD